MTRNATRARRDATGVLRRTYEASCSCGWSYRNTVRTDVDEQARWHRQNAARQELPS